MEWYLKVLRQYADFSGRARRTEYWMFQLFNMVIFLVAYAIVIGAALLLRNGSGGGAVAGIFGMLLMLYMLGVVVPSIAVSVRRLHDTDRSGWFYLLAFIPFVGAIVVLVFACQEGTRGPNSYGPDPKAEAGGSDPATRSRAAIPSRAATSHTRGKANTRNRVGRLLPRPPTSTLCPADGRRRGTVVSSMTRGCRGPGRRVPRPVGCPAGGTAA